MATRTTLSTERARLTRPPEPQSTWARMGTGWRIISILTLGIGYAIYNCLYPVAIRTNEAAERVLPERPREGSSIAGRAEVVGQADVRTTSRALEGAASSSRPSVPLPPDFTAERALLEDSELFLSAITFVPGNRANLEVQIPSNNEQIALKNNEIVNIAQRLEVLADGSGITMQDFLGHILRDQPVKEIHYYRFIKEGNEVPLSNKKEIEETLNRAQGLAADVKRLVSANRRNSQTILQEYSSPEGFKSLVERGIPFELVIDGEAISRLGPPGQRLLSITTQLNHTLNGGQGIALSERDPAIIVQHFLTEFAESTPLTVTNQERDQLRVSRHQLITVPRTQNVRVVQGTRRQIQSMRRVELQDITGNVVRSFNWSEIIDFSGGNLEITRRVVETE